LSDYTFNTLMMQDELRRRAEAERREAERTRQQQDREREKELEMIRKQYLVGVAVGRSTHPMGWGGGWSGMEDGFCVFGE
jgi:hypothetical protein